MPRSPARPGSRRGIHGIRRCHGPQSTPLRWRHSRWRNAPRWGRSRFRSRGDTIPTKSFGPGRLPSCRPAAAGGPDTGCLMDDRREPRFTESGAGYCTEGKALAVDQALSIVRAGRFPVGDGVCAGHMSPPAAWLRRGSDAMSSDPSGRTRQSPWYQHPLAADSTRRSSRPQARQAAPGGERSAGPTPAG